MYTVNEKKLKTDDNNKRECASQKMSKLQQETIRIISMENKFFLKNKND